MRAHLLLLALLSLSLIGQTVGQPVAAKQETLAPALATVKITLWALDMNHPLQGPSHTLGRLPECSPDGRIFLDFMVPPNYFYSNIKSISSSDGKTAEFPVERIAGLTKTVLDSYDPGVSDVTMILSARPVGKGGASSAGLYLALYSYDGELEKYSRLDLDFQPVQASQLTEDSFLVVGYDPQMGHSHFAMIDSRGKVLRDLDSNSIMPSGQQLKSLILGLKIPGNLENAPPASRTSIILSAFRYTHSNRGLLVFEPGEEAQVVELLRTGEVRTVRLKLPKQQVAHSMFAGGGKWYVRAYLKGAVDQDSLYEVDPYTGVATARVDTSGVLPGSIACFQDAGLSALRWIDGKAYLQHGDLR